MKPSPANIRAARLRAGFTQAELARRIGKREWDIIRWEKLEGGDAPRVESLAAIARETRTSLAALLEGGDDEDESPSRRRGSRPQGRVVVSVADALDAFERLDAIADKLREQDWRVSADVRSVALALAARVLEASCDAPRAPHLLHQQLEILECAREFARGYIAEKGAGGEHVEDGGQAAELVLDPRKAFEFGRSIAHACEFLTVYEARLGEAT